MESVNAAQDVEITEEFFNKVTTITNVASKAYLDCIADFLAKEKENMTVDEALFLFFNSTAIFVSSRVAALTKSIKSFGMTGSLEQTLNKIVQCAGIYVKQIEACESKETLQ